MRCSFPRYVQSVRPGWWSPNLPFDEPFPNLHKHVERDNYEAPPHDETPVQMIRHMQTEEGKGTSFNRAWHAHCKWVASLAVSRHTSTPATTRTRRVIPSSCDKGRLYAERPGGKGAERHGSSFWPG